MVDVRPMGEEYIHIDCLHHGPVDPTQAPRRENLYQAAHDLPPHPWSDEVIADVARRYKQISEGWRGDPSREFMREMVRRYGTCAMLAWDDGKVVGQLRFYPLDVAQMVYKAAPQKQHLMGEGGAMAFEADAGTLWIQCIMTARPYEDAEGAARMGARKGVGQALVRALVAWATGRGWKRIVKQAHADLDWMYGQYGGAGKAFWEKAGFRVVGTVEQDPPENKEWRERVEREADAQGMSRHEAWTWFHMACDLPGSPAAETGRGAVPGGRP